MTRVLHFDCSGFLLYLVHTLWIFDDIFGASGCSPKSIQYRTRVYSVRKHRIDNIENNLKYMCKI